MASAVTAQSLTTTFAGGNGQSGNMFDIVATQSVTINSFDVNLAPGTYNLEVYRVTAGGTYVGSEANASAWTLIGSATGVVSTASNVPTPLPITINTPIPASTTMGFYVTIAGAGTMNYTNGTTVGAVYVQDAFIQFLEGAGIAYPYAGTFQPRIWNGNIYYTPTGGGTFATNTVLGTGCGQSYASFYEAFASATAFDLANTTFTFLNTGTGYTVVNSIPGTFVTPTAAAQPVAPGLLDGESLFTLSAAMPIPGGSTNTLNVCTKGYIGAAQGNGVDFSPTGPELLAFAQTTWACWHDYDQTPTGSGPITFEEVGGIAYVTWNGTYTWLSTSPKFVQWQFDVVSGTITLVVGAYGGAVDPVVVGFSPGGTSLNPGSTDLSALAGAIVLGAVDQAPLTVAATSRPVTGTNWGLSVNAIPASGTFGVTVIGLSDPGINDLAFLGMPGCGLRASLDVMSAFIVSGSSHAYAVPVPSNPALIGFDVYSTAAVFQNPPSNAFGAITANGVKGDVGDI